MLRSVADVEEALRENLVRRTKSAANPERTLLKQFKQMDVDANQTVSFEEFRKAVEPFVHGVKPELLRALFDEWDTDKSGGLEVNEFVGGLFQTREEKDKAAGERARAKVEAQKNSILSEDIIETAKKSRALREQEATRYTAKEGSDSNKAALAKSRDPKNTSNLQARPTRDPQASQVADRKTQSGAFVKGWTGESGVPDTVRYRVSSTWVNVHSPQVSAQELQEQVRLSCEAPKDILELEFVYGFNPSMEIFTRENGELVYACAAVGVVYDPRTHSQRFFLEHNDDITALALSPTNKVAASGQMGKESVIYVWNVDTMQRLSKLSGIYERMITCIGFSVANPSLLVAVGGDNHHMMGLWNHAQGKLLAQAPTQNGTPPQVTCVRFDDVGTSDRFVTCGFKHFKLWVIEGGCKLGGGKSMRYNNVSPVPDEMRCAAWAGDDTIVSGGSNGVLYVWDAAKMTCKRAIPAHSGPVQCLLPAADNQMLSAGAKDSKLLYWSTASASSSGTGALSRLDTIEVAGGFSARSLAFIPRGKATPVLIAGTMQGSIVAFSPDAGAESQWKTLSGGHTGDLYAVAAHPSNPSAFCTAGEDNVLCIWDAASKQLIHSMQLPGPARSVDVSPRGSDARDKANLIAVGSRDGSFCIIHTGDFKVVFKVKHCQEAISDIKFSPDGSMLAVGSHDNFVDLYKVDAKFEHSARLKGHSSYITHIDWSRDSKFLQSNSGAYERLVWNADSGTMVRQAETARDAEWVTFTCTLGFPVLGIWSAGENGTDVNAVSRSNDLRLLASGDDSGLVKLFHFPVLAKDAPCHTLRGHSSHVMCVRWLADSQRLLSVGGHDQTILQWKRIKSSEVPVAPVSVSVQAPKPWQPSSSWK